MVFVILVSLLLCVLENLKKKKIKMLELKPSWAAGREKELMRE